MTTSFGYQVVKTKQKRSSRSLEKSGYHKLADMVTRFETIVPEKLENPDSKKKDPNLILNSSSKT